MKHVRILIYLLMFFALTSCTPNEEVWTGKQKNPVEVVCGKSCKTILFKERFSDLSPYEKKKIRQFVYHSSKHRPIYVSPCVKNKDILALNEDRIKVVRNYIHQLGYKSVRLKPTLPYHIETKNCVNLVKGKIYLYVQHCPNNTINPSVNEIGSSFGCTTSYNFAQMLDNPWNLLALPGDNGTEGDRVALGIENYRTGKLAQVDTEGSS